MWYGYISFSVRRQNIRQLNQILWSLRSEAKLSLKKKATLESFVRRFLSSGFRFSGSLSLHLFKGKERYALKLLDPTNAKKARLLTFFLFLEFAWACLRFLERNFTKIILRIKSIYFIDWEKFCLSEHRNFIFKLEKHKKCVWNIMQMSW